MTEATVWPTFAPNRACQLCDHGRSEGCKRLEVSGVARSTAFNAARAPWAAPVGPTHGT